MCKGFDTNFIVDSISCNFSIQRKPITVRTIYNYLFTLIILTVIRTSKNLRVSNFRPEGWSPVKIPLTLSIRVCTINKTEKLKLI